MGHGSLSWGRIWKLNLRAIFGNPQVPSLPLPRLPILHVPIEPAQFFVGELFVRLHRGVPVGFVREHDQADGAAVDIRVSHKR